MHRRASLTIAIWRTQSLGLTWLMCMNNREIMLGSEGWTTSWCFSQAGGLFNTWAIMRMRVKPICADSGAWMWGVARRMGIGLWVSLRTSRDLRTEVLVSSHPTGKGSVSSNEGDMEAQQRQRFGSEAQAVFCRCVLSQVGRKSLALARNPKLHQLRLVA